MGKWFAAINPNPTWIFTNHSWLCSSSANLPENRVATTRWQRVTTGVKHQRSPKHFEAFKPSSLQESEHLISQTWFWTSWILYVQILLCQVLWGPCCPDSYRDETEGPIGERISWWRPLSHPAWCVRAQLEEPVSWRVANELPPIPNLNGLGLRDVWVASLGLEWHCEFCKNYSFT